MPVYNTANFGEKMKDDILEIMLSQEVLQKRVKELALQITKDYGDEPVIFVSILKGAVVFLADLIRYTDLKHTIDFMAVSSYKNTKSSGIVRLIMDLRESPEGKNVLIVEDIIDTGLTMRYICENLLTRRLKSLKICSLLYKPTKQHVYPDIKIDYLGFEIPDKFVVGYGMDYNELYRNLPYVGILKPEIYRRK